MGTDINIKEAIMDKKTDFNIKRFKIGPVSFERPEKTLDASTLKRTTFDLIKDNFKFREGSKVVSSKNISNLYDSSDDDQIQKFFLKKNWASSIPSVLNFTFNFNPYKEIENQDELQGFLDRYHAYSNLFLTIPNIRLYKTLKVTMPNGKQKNQKIQIIGLDDYMKFVESTYDSLNYKNNKPIFLPIPLRMGQRKIKELVKMYLSKQYYYYWVDFDARYINENRIGDLRHIYKIINESGYAKNVIFYFTNIKREIQLNSKNDNSEASDVLASTAGANIIGVNREPRIPFPGPRPPTPNNYKSRILNKDTYYYVKTNDPNFYDKVNYVPQNALILDDEFNNQTEYFLINNTLEGYLNKKQMLVNYHDGAILKVLESKEPIQQKFEEYFMNPPL